MDASVGKWIRHLAIVRRGSQITDRHPSGVASSTRKILRYGKTPDPFVETPDDMVARALRNFIGRGKGEPVAFNDEAHHCYQDKPLADLESTQTTIDGVEKEDLERNADARVWFKGLLAVKRKLGIKAVYTCRRHPST